ncbi:hypothetical protein [Cupriavidus sp. PET2-C1]
MSKPKVRISITTNIDTTEWGFGRRVIEAFCNTDSRLTPEYFDNNEAITKPFKGVADCEELWAPEVVIDAGVNGRIITKWNSMWRRGKTVKCRADMHHTLLNQRGQLRPGWFTFDAAADTKVDWLGLFRQLCELAEPKFAVMHLFTDIEVRRGAFGVGDDARIAQDDFVAGAPAVALEQRGIPNLAWATFFGKEYAAEVDAKKMRDYDFIIDEIDQGSLLILTPRLFDVADNFLLFSTRRVEAKELFRPGMFRITNEPPF